MNRRAQQGLSLLELMIALTIGLGLLAGLTSVFVNSSRSHTELARASQQIENGRFAIQTLQEDIWHAGYYGRHVAYTTSAPTALPRSEEHTSELQSQSNLVCRLLLEKK